MKKALITGGAGFIGSNIAHKLVEENYQVTILDNLYLGSEENLEDIKEDIKFIEGSVLNKKDVKEAVKDQDIVFHQAARSSAPMHKENPSKSARVNVEGFINILKESEEQKVEKVVYASTSSMYGSVEPPHKENMGEKPTNLYTSSKMSRELYAQVFSDLTEVHTTGLRYFSVYGPREKAKGQYANVVSQFLWKIQKDEAPVIFGDGTQTRDFTYVEDIVKANLLAAKTKEKTNGEVYNIGTGKETSFNQVVEKITEKLGKEIEPEHVENPIENYVQRTKADISKAQKELGYKPEYTFEEGLQKTINFYS